MSKYSLFCTKLGVVGVLYSCTVTFPLLHLWQVQARSGTPSTKRNQSGTGSKSRLCSEFPHLNVDVHALLPRHLFKTESLSNNVFQLELGLQAVGASHCQVIQVLRHLDHFGGDQDVSVRHTALILRLAHGGHNCLSDEEKFFLRTPFSNLARRCWVHLWFCIAQVGKWNDKVDHLWK